MMRTLLLRDLPLTGSGFGLLLGLLAAAGCAPPTGSLSGKVLLNGKALPGGKVAVLSVDGTGNPVSTDLDEEGNYHLDKVPVGQVKITVSNMHLKAGSDSGPIGVGAGPKPAGGTGGSPMPGRGPTSIPPEALAKAKEGKDNPPPEQKHYVGKYVPIDTKYADAAKTPLQYTVQKGNQTHDIELK